MTSDRFRFITDRYAGLRIAVVGDFCLDRYLEIDPSRRETSIETGLPVHNIDRIRSQPGASGTILNNLVALGVGEIVAVGFCGIDGEGFELRRGLSSLRGVDLDHFVTSSDRSTFTYIKPLVIRAGQPPEELSRFDIKNWTATSKPLESRLIQGIREVTPQVDAIIIMDQVSIPETGVVTRGLLEALGDLARSRQTLPVIADSRQGLRGWPPVVFKMNGAELEALLGLGPGPGPGLTLVEVGSAATELASRNGRPAFVTLADRGIVVGLPEGPFDHVPAWPIRGPIDVVGAGDAVTANIAAALAGAATPFEAAELAVLAGSIVIHQLGTTGAASIADLADLLQSQTGTGPTPDPSMVP